MKATVFRFTNVAILAALVVLVVTGTISFFWIATGWIVDVHRVAAWALLALIPWKVGIAWRSLKRGPGRRLDRNVVMLVSLTLAALAVTVIVLALLWTWQIGAQTAWLRQLLLWWHWVLAFVLLIPLAVHAWRRWPRPKSVDFASRRGAFRLLGLGAAGLVGWWLAETLADARNPAHTPRLVTGSRQQAAFTGNDFPITSEPAPDLDPGIWNLHVGGAVASPFSLSLADLLDLPPAEFDARLDCTNGWWTIQTWRGVALPDLLDRAALSPDALAIRLTSVTGYTQVFSLQEAQHILIATHVGGEALSHWHGAPARAVVPTRRGWFWVKWLSAVEALDSLGQILRHPLSIR